MLPKLITMGLRAQMLRRPNDQLFSSRPIISLEILVGRLQAGDNKGDVTIIKKEIYDVFFHERGGVSSSIYVF